MSLILMEDNLHGHVAYLQRQLPGMHVGDAGDLLLVDSGLPCETFNKICRARLDEPVADGRIAEAVGYFRRRQRPFSWWVGPCSRPSDLGARLERAGLRAAERELGMLAKPADLPREQPQADGLEIRRVATLAELQDFVRVTAGNWEPPDEQVGVFFEAASAVLLDPACPMRLYVGYADGVAAAASELFLSPKVAGIHMVSTGREFRRRGFGLAMTWTAAWEGCRAGAELVALQASEMGRGVYERLGFRGCGQFTEYL
jgi:ribosomal protein S18 acetylase RimI-like enzyme